MHIDIAVIAAPDRRPVRQRQRRRTARRPAARSASRWPTRSTPTRSSSSPTTWCRSPASRGRSRATTSTAWSWSTSIGDPAKIVSGTTEITKSPDRLLIAELRRAVLRDAGHHARRLLVPGRRRRHRARLRRSSCASMMREAGVKARFVRGGSHQVPGRDARGGADRLHPRRPDLRPRRRALDARRPAPRRRPRPSPRYNYHGKGNFASMVDVAVLGATEVDLRLQRQRRHPLRRPAAARHRRLAELPLRRVHDPARSRRSATASR